MSEQALTPQQQTELEAATFRKLIAHLDERKDVQNIDLMILAGFCRNCLSKWYKASADDQGLALDLDQAREKVYGMTYAAWKDNHQTEATPEQLGVDSLGLVEAVFAIEELEEAAKLAIITHRMPVRHLTPSMIADLNATFRLR